MTDVSRTLSTTSDSQHDSFADLRGAPKGPMGLRVDRDTLRSGPEDSGGAEGGGGR